MSAFSNYRLSGDDLVSTLDNWNSLMNFKVHLIACGGTAMTLLDIKDSTKDINFVVPKENEYKRMMKFLKAAGYRDASGGLHHSEDPNFIYQFWPGNQVFTTPLPEPVLDAGKHIFVRKWRHIYLGALNLMDLIITKLFRGTSVDVSDCMTVFTEKEISFEQLLNKYQEASRYDLNPEKVMLHYYCFTEKLYERGLINETSLQKVKSCL